ncbi:MAG: carbonate dehydratase [Leptothrix sp. (in: Bacteria)]|nr:carbonate dehydratase [Leptothrix sp. (in: b-proteobacteria)]
MLTLCAGLLLPVPSPASDALPARPAAVGSQQRPAKPGPALKADATPAAEEADAAPADPLEQLRVRLSERLSAARTSQAGGPYDLRVSARTGGAAVPTAHAAKGAADDRKAGSKQAAGHAAKAAAHVPHWGYQGSAGPDTWGGLKPEFSLCKSGQRQSPIDIRGGLAVDLDPVRFDYQASPFAVLDNGHTVQVELGPGNSIEVGGKRFELKQFHFHRPSEERIDGRQFEMSLHLVHQDAQGRLAVVALLFDKGPAHPVLQQVWNNLPLERGEAAPARAPMELTALLPADRRYYTYMGSLTTPPCSEGVQWIVMRQPVTLTPDQIEIFARLYPMNARPIQAASGRRILQSN